MTNIRIFIAGHVIGTSDTERAEIRQRMTDDAELFETIGFDVVNPVHLMDETGDRNDMLCRYYREMLDCSFVMLYADHAKFEECQTAGATAIIRNMGILRENDNLIMTDIVRPVILGIMNVTGMMFTDYAGIKSRAENVLMARALFAHYCRKCDTWKPGSKPMQNRDIGLCLHGCTHDSAKTIGSKLNDQYNKLLASSTDFVQYDKELAEYLNNPQ